MSNSDSRSSVKIFKPSLHQLQLQLWPHFWADAV